MITVGTYEAKTHLPKLIEKVAGGETVTITRHGKPVARLVPAAGPGRERRSTEEIAAAFRKLRASVKPGGPSIRELIRAGRKY